MQRRNLLKVPVIGVFTLGPIFKKWQRNVGFAPIDSSAEMGPALSIAICLEIGDAMLKSTGNSGPAYSV